MKTLLLIACIFFANTALGQYFTLTHEGFVSNDKKNYVVMDVPETAKAVLFKNMLSALTSMYTDPKKALSVVEGESITITGFHPKALPNKLHKNVYDMEYTVNIQFKDNKIRIDAPTFDLGYTSYSGAYIKQVLVTEGFTKQGIFSKNGSVSLKRTKEALDVYFNDLIKEALEKSKKTDDW
ncbi:MAG: DUF4468 domain-containing protein [Mucilaginibacter polytrichastri]|nr:DUF4468 domain-containing protein [Mucilaginibacter polytrichastri]